MSRILRNRPPAVPSVGKAARKSTAARNFTSDEDEDYSGVDLISDSDEEEPDVEDAEEQAIIEEEDDDDDDNGPSASQQIDDDQSSWGGFDLDKDSPLDESAFFDEATMLPDVMIDPTAWQAVGESDEGRLAGSRHVRFDLSDDDSTSESENLFPDIFLDQDSLDPGFRKAIENDRDNDNDDPISEDGSYWDYEGDQAGASLFQSSDKDAIKTENVDDDDDDDDDAEDSDSSTGSSGYETDEGETTEEDLPPAAKYVPARQVLRRQSSDSSLSDEVEEVVQRTPLRRSGPRLGTWVTDSSKPFAIVDSNGKKLMMFRARVNRRFSFNDTPVRPMLGLTEESDQVEDMSPMISNSANLMMSAMYASNDGRLSGQALGPPEAFYPFVSVGANGTIQKDSASSFDEDDMDDDDENWDIQDLVDFGDSDDELPEDESTSPNATDVPSTPARPQNKEEHVHPLLEHFDRGVVGAFRRNQNRHALISRNAASREGLAFSGPFRQGTIRGIKGGRLAAANTPITPMRRRKVETAATPSSPMEQKKRKFSGEPQHGHKRSKSLI